MSDLRYAAIPPPARGINTASGPESLDAEEALDLENWMVDLPARLRLRSPILTNSIDSEIPGDRHPLTAWSSSNNILIGLRGITTASQHQRLTPQQASMSSTSDDSDFVYPDLTGLLYNRPSDTLSTIAFTDQRRVPGVKSARIQNYVYGNALSDNTVPQDVLQWGDKEMPYTPFLQWNGTATQPTIIEGPIGGLDIKPYLNRLFVLGGMRSDGIGNNPNANSSILWFSDGVGQDGFLTSDHNNWKDDISGLYNFIDIGSDDSYDVAVGLAILNQQLVIFKQHSIWVMYGDEPDNFSVKKVVSGTGCADSRSIVEHDDAVFFASEDGILSFDGIQLQELSEPIKDGYREWLPDVALDQSSTGGGYISMALLDRSHLFLTMGRVLMDAVGDGVHSLSPVNDNKFCGIYNLEQQAWTRFSSQCFYNSTLGAPNLLIRTREGVYACDLGELGLLDTCVNSFYLESNIRTLKGGDYLAGIIPVGIDATFISAPLRLSSPPDRSQLHRVLTDFRYQGPNGDDPDFDDTFTFEVIEGDSQASLVADQLKQYGDLDEGLPNWMRRRQVTDVFHEATDLVYKLTFTGTYNDTFAVSSRDVEWQGAIIEYKTTRQRSTS